MVNKMNTKPEIIKSKFDLTSTMDLKWSIKNLINKAVKIIKAKDQEAKALQNAIFGSEGELFKSKQAALKPILDEIAKAVEKVVRQKRLDFLFDKANDGLALIYTNPVHDYSDYILEELGLEIDPNLKK